jgi:hypothetical protein
VLMEKFTTFITEKYPDLADYLMSNARGMPMWGSMGAIYGFGNLDN